MSYFSEWANFRVEKTTVIHYYGKKYTTAKGLAMTLGDSIASRILEQNHNNVKKYGSAYLNKSNEANLKKWMEHRRRIRAKFIRRATPLLEKLWL